MAYSKINAIINAYKSKRYELGERLINDYLFRDVNSAIDDFCLVVATVYKQQDKNKDVLKLITDFKKALGQKEFYVAALNQNPYGMQCVALSNAF